MAAWNVTICSSASSLLKMNSKNRVEQVLGMVPSPQVSPSTIRGELYNINGEQQGGCGGGGGGLSPKRGYYAAFEQMADEEMMVEEEEIVGGAGGVVLKKRRLSVDQVRFLESSFESENKLEPERKVQIAQRLGLQPRQVAVWFQNRRARSKSKQLERDFLALKADYHAVLLENEKLQAEVDRLTAQLMREGSALVVGGGHTEAGAKHVLMETKTSGSSSSNNCANSEGPTLKVEAADHEASTASGDDVRGNELNMGGDGDEEQLSPCTILADVNVSASVVASSGGGRAKTVAVAASESATSTYEEFHFLTNCMQQAYAHQLLDFYTDYDNNFFITSSFDDPWISDS